MTTTGKGFAPAAIVSLRNLELVRTDYIAITGSTWIELTETGRQVACAMLVFGV